MAIDHAGPRSRRSLLAAGLGGLVATVASALGRPNVARAGVDGDVVLGQVNTSANATEVHTTSLLGDAIVGNTLTGGGRGVVGFSDGGYGVFGSSSSSYGVFGQSQSNAGIYGAGVDHPGVIGHSDNTIGVSGISPNGSGVAGSSGIGTGVAGSSNATNQAGVRGSTGGDATGVMGYSGSSLPATAPAKTGVYGEAAQDSTAKGVWGKSNGGRGVYGQATSGQGVRGYASTTGTALYGSTAGPKKGLALHTIGRVKLDNAAGIATITSGHNSVTVTPGIDLLATSAVVATLQGSAGGTTNVHRVQVDATADTFIIFLTGNAANDVKVAWHVFG
jgi:hypothetical protein